MPVLSKGLQKAIVAGASVTGLVLATVAHGQEMTGALGAWSTIQNLTFTLIDLDPTDGVTASMSFAQGVYGPGGHTIANAWTSLDTNSLGDQVSGLPLNNEFMLQTSQTSTQAGVFANTTVNENGMSSMATSTVLGGDAAAMATTRSQFNGIYSPSYPYTIWLSPNSQLVVSAFASTFAAVGTGCSDAHGYCGSAYADARIFGRRIEGDRIAEIFQSSFTSNAGLGGITFTDASRIPTGLVASHSGQLSITFTNDTAHAVSQHLTVETAAVVTAVPEPSTYALMALGLAFMVSAKKKRRPGMRQALVDFGQRSIHSLPRLVDTASDA